ncbi:MAG: glutamate 5-kinase [Ilumatobacteraceae bacterium]|nr:glutamate 5-kinase [Ilumatobacteraceae bacterium]
MKIVVKIGTSSLTNNAGVLRHDVVAAMAQQISQVKTAGHEIILVTSGAVALGIAVLSLDRRPTDVLSLQALSAVGQPQLMAAYAAEFKRHGHVTAQVLLVPHDFVDRTQYLHARNTMLKLLELGCVPVVNENDAIANNEIRYGDNDHLSALVSHLVSADVLLLLTDTDGLYTANPHTDPMAKIISVVTAEDPLLQVDAQESGTDRGSGGMASKIAAARIASWSGVVAVIASAETPDVIARVINGDDQVGTRFLPHDRRLSARKLWIAFASEVEGSVVVDAGAREALISRGTSLLPAGVVGVSGDFMAGSTIEIRDQSGLVIARGMAAMSITQVQQSQGKRSSDVDSFGSTEVVHRDDLVIL